MVLDDRPVKTPARNALLLPSGALAEAIAAEWNKQSETIDPRSMPLTGLANAAIDRVSPDPDSFAAGLAKYGETDLLCYRADAPHGSDRAAAAALGPDPRLGAAPLRRGFRGHFRDPPPRAAASDDRSPCPSRRSRAPFALAALSPLVTLSGSLIVALAIAEQALDVESAWSAATIDEAWQAEKWGEDEEAATRMANRRAEFDSAERFLRLLD